MHSCNAIRWLTASLSYSNFECTESISKTLRLPDWYLTKSVRHIEVSFAFHTFIVYLFDVVTNLKGANRQRNSSWKALSPAHINRAEGAVKKPLNFISPKFAKCAPLTFNSYDATDLLCTGLELADHETSNFEVSDMQLWQGDTSATMKFEYHLELEFWLCGKSAETCRLWPGKKQE